MPTTIRIRNCNNITTGDIDIHSNKLNILFGRNGTGKSTIARAISLTSHGKPLDELRPYGIADENNSPQIEGIPVGNVPIFNDDYVRQYVYQPDTLIANTFEVLIRSQEYDNAKSTVDNTLSNIKAKITGRQEIIDLKNQIGALIGTIKLTTQNRIAKRGGTKAVLEGKGAYFNPPEELQELEPFFIDDIVPKWAAWRLQGYEQFGDKGLCPYCSTGDTEETTILNNVFAGSFDKASITAAAAIMSALEALAPYLNKEKIDELTALFGVKEGLAVLETQLTKLCAEAKYLHDCLAIIVEFNGSSVERNNIDDLAETLANMKIDFRAIDTYFISELLVAEISAINNEVDNLLTQVNVLRGEIGRYNTYIQNKIANRKQDINDFLSIAGFKYTFDVQITRENEARALLKFILPEGVQGEAHSTGRHLSWGERHAFALILFMFDAISQDAELVILDDPISSFDTNKKYAIINRLFKTGEQGNSLYEKTTLMLTHDFEPIIDYIETSSGRQAPTSCCATYLENEAGQLQLSPIRRGDDILSSVVLLKELAQDVHIDIAARIGCLRKFIEHQYRNPQDASEAYHILSSLIHGRLEPTRDLAGNEPLTANQIAVGTAFIKKFIADFDYEVTLTQLTPQALLNRYDNEESAYIKMIILRAYTHQNQEARERLRRKNDVLRKYIDEAYHIENDYIFSLDIRRFNIVPENYIADADEYVANEKENHMPNE